MARTAKSTNTEPVVDAATADDSAVAAVNSVEENMNDETATAATKRTTNRRKNARQSADVEDALSDSDMIEVESLIPNVVYEDSRTGNYYEWEEIGHCEDMTFDEVKNMHRKYKTYFNDMWLKPTDERVIKKLGLSRTYDKYNFLIDESNYTNDHIDEVLDGLSSAPASLKIAIVNRIKDMVADGTVSDIKVVRKLEKRLDIDLISFL
jgi:hypothetical protein|nr:MAG TPA: hypothetical protein [Caudoviricetes sp.]